MRFIKQWPVVSDQWPLILIKLSSLPVWRFFFVETLLPHRLGFLFSGFEYSFFVAAYALVGVQAFKNKFGGGDLLLGTLFLGDAERSQLVDQALNFFQVFQRFKSCDRIAQLNLAAQVEPLHDLLHVGAGEVFVVGLGDRGADQFAAYEVCSFHLALVFEFQLAGDGRERGVDIADAGHYQLFVVAEGAAFGVRDYVLHCGDRQALTYSAAFIDFLIFAGSEGDALDYFLNVGGKMHRVGFALSAAAGRNSVGPGFLRGDGDAFIDRCRVVGANFRADAVFERGDDFSSSRVVFGICAEDDSNVERKTDGVALNLYVAFLHDVEQADLNFSGEVGKFVDGEDAAIGAGQQAVVDGELARQFVTAAGGLDGIDIAD